MIALTICRVMIGILTLAFMLSLLTPSASMAVVRLHKTWGGSGDDVGNAVAVDSLGSIYIAGRTSSFGFATEKVLVLKYDSSGLLSWSRTWGGSGVDVANGIAVDSAGNIVVVGETSSFGVGGDVFILKFDAAGSLLWQRTWGGNGTDIGNAVATDASGNIYVAGRTNSFNASSYRALLLKFDASGNFIWALTTGTGTFEDALAVTVDSSGNIIFTGESDSYGTRGHILFFKLQPVMTGFPIPLNYTIIGGSGGDFARGISTDSLGNIYIAGDTDSSGAGLSDLLLLKLNVKGALQWQRTWGGVSIDVGWAVTTDPSGNAYVAGESFSFGSGSTSTSDAVLLKLDSSGSLTDSLVWGGRSSDSANGIALDSRGAIIAGYVTEAPPYTESLGNQTLGLSSLSLKSYYGSISYSTAITSRTPSGSLGFPSGSDTYSGGYDVFFLRYGPPTQSSPPQSLTANGGVSEISLSWTVPLTNGGSPITNYNVYRGTSSGGETFLSDVGNQTSYTDSSVTTSLSYYYVVKAVNVVGQSSASNEASAVSSPSVIITPLVLPWQWFAAASGVGVVSVAGVVYIIRPPLPRPDSLKFAVKVEVHSEILEEKPKT